MASFHCPGIPALGFLGIAWVLQQSNDLRADEKPCVDVLDGSLAPLSQLHLMVVLSFTHGHPALLTRFEKMLSLPGSPLWPRSGLNFESPPLKAAG